jgi:hypothetical protein
MWLSIVTLRNYTNYPTSHLIIPVDRVAMTFAAIQ